MIVTEWSKSVEMIRTLVPVPSWPIIEAALGSQHGWPNVAKKSWNEDMGVSEQWDIPQFMRNYHRETKNFQTKFILVAFNIIQLNWAAACHLLAPKTTAFQFFHSGLFHFNIISRNHAAPSRKDDICNEKGHRGVVLIRSGVHRFFKHPINLYSRFDLYCNYCHSIYVMTVAVAFDYISICIICPSHFHIFPPGKKKKSELSPAHLLTDESHSSLHRAWPASLALFQAAPTCLA